MSILAIDDRKIVSRNFVLSRHLNKLRWLVLSIVIAVLILLPFLHLYQTYIAAHAYDLLSPNEKLIYDSMEWLTAPFTNDPATDLDYIKGTTWTGTLFGLKLSDPLALIAHASATLTLHWPLLLAALIPVLLTAVFGRFFCGWICPATFIYELNDNLGTWLQKSGLPTGRRRFDLRLKYLVLLLGVFISAFAGAALFANIYPPAIIGREIYYAIAMGGLGAGSVFFLITMGFDLLVARRGFCRYICPGGALYSLLGRFRLFRIKREVAQCNDCAKCNTVCQFGLDPMRDDFGQECNNCTACMAVCPTDTLKFTTSIHDMQFQGPGHLGHHFKKEQREKSSQVVVQTGEKE
jgi:ferredoxin-type protein NapH